MAARDSTSPLITGQPNFPGKSNGSRGVSLRRRDEDLIIFDERHEGTSTSQQPFEQVETDVNTVKDSQTTTGTASTTVQYPLPESTAPVLCATNVTRSSVSLSVDGSIFRAMRHHLEKSPILKQMLSPGVYFEDRPVDFLFDAEIFKHILNYLRTDTYPFFWNKSEGFDFALYNRVQQDATVLELWELRNWIRAQGYLGAIKIIYDETYSEVNQTAKHVVSGNGEVERHVVPRLVQTCVCPKKILKYSLVAGKQRTGGKECKKALDEQGGQEDWEFVPHTEVVVVKRTYQFNPVALEKSFI